MIIKSLAGEVDFLITLFARFVYSLPLLVLFAYLARNKLLFKINNWKNILEDEIRKKIEDSFKKEMIELGYL